MDPTPSLLARADRCLGVMRGAALLAGPALLALLSFFIWLLN